LGVVAAPSAFLVCFNSARFFFFFSLGALYSSLFLTVFFFLVGLLVNPFFPAIRLLFFVPPCICFGGRFYPALAVSWGTARRSPLAYDPSYPPSPGQPCLLWPSTLSVRAFFPLFVWFSPFPFFFFYFSVFNHPLTRAGRSSVEAYDPQTLSFV